MRVLIRFRLLSAFLVLTGTLIVLGVFDSLFAAFSGNFTPNQELELPLTAGSLPLQFIVRGLEPSLRVDVEGTIYVSSIRGVPGGIDMHRWSPIIDPSPNGDGTLPFEYLGQPDNCGILASGCDAIGIAEGGGDTDIANNFPAPGEVPNLAVTSQTLAPGETSFRSSDRGETFTEPNVISNPIVGEDREWMDAIDEMTVYMAVHDAATFNINVFRSLNGGESYFDGYGQGIDPQTFSAAGGVGPQSTANVAGSFRVDTTQCPSRGNLYTIFVAPNDATENATAQPFRSVYIGVSTDSKLNLPVYTFTDHKIFAGPIGSSAANLFPAIDVDDFGNLYAVWSNNTDILFSYSSDAGTTWSVPHRVNENETVGKSNVFPWIASDANGHVVIVWYGADRAGNSNDPIIHEPCPAGSITCMSGWTNWNVYLAETINGHSTTPSFVQSQISDHVIHRGTISTGGLTGNANRNLADYFQVALDPQHRANVAFSDDHKLSPLVVAGHEGNDDPQARRMIRVNFTRQIQPTAGIVTSGSCAPQPPEVGNKITGGGRLGSPVNFGFVAKDNPLNGSVQYQDDDQNLKVHSSNGIEQVTFTGNCATFSGKAKVNQQIGYQFTVNACDLAEPGANNDFLSIDVTGTNFSYHKEGVITEGNIQMHNQ